MTITTTVIRDIYTGTGANTDLSTTFPFDEVTEIVVTSRVTATGAETTLVRGTHFNVTGGDGLTGTVTPIDGATDFPDTVTWTIERQTLLTQQVDYIENDEFGAETHEGALDKLTRIVQELSDAMARALVFPPTDALSLSGEIPNSTLRALNLLGFDASGEVIAVASTTDANVTPFMEEVLDDTTAADARATLEAQEDVISARGDLVRGDSSGVAEAYAKGARGSLLKTDANDVVWLPISATSGHVLESNGTDPLWVTRFQRFAENRIINGCCRVGQRSAYTLVKDGWDFGIVDRMQGMATGTAVSAGTLTQATAAAVGTTGYAAHFSGVTLTGTGILYLRHRIEHKEAVRFINGPGTFQCKVRHDVGSAVDYTITVNKADSQDVFSGGTTEIDNDGGTSVASGTNTTLEFSIADMGSCGNGIEIEIKIEAGEITTKNFWITELQFVPWTSAPSFIWGDYDRELVRCQRFYQIMGDSTATVPRHAVYTGGSGYFHTTMAHTIQMRTAPTVNVNNVGNWAGANPTVTSDGKLWVMKYASAPFGQADQYPDSAGDNVEFDAEFA